jgi:hypothetical protein
MHDIPDLWLSLGVIALLRTGFGLAKELDDVIPDPRESQAVACQDLCGHTFPYPEQPKEEVLRTDVLVEHGISLLVSVS